MKITDKGQVTIPIRIRRKMGLLPNTEVEFVVKGDRVLLQKAGTEKRRGRNIVESLRGRATRRMTTDEIMALTRGE